MPPFAGQKYLISSSHSHTATHTHTHTHTHTTTTTHLPLARLAMDPNNMAPVGVDEIPDGFTADPNSGGGSKNAERQAQVDSLLDQILDPAGERRSF